MLNDKDFQSLFWTLIGAIVVVGYFAHHLGYQEGFRDGTARMQSLAQEVCNDNGQWVVCRSELKAAANAY